MLMNTVEHLAAKKPDVTLKRPEVKAEWTWDFYLSGGQKHNCNFNYWMCKKEIVC